MKPLRQWAILLFFLGVPPLQNAIAQETPKQPAARPLLLEPVAEPRKLPERLLGASAEPFFGHLIDDPHKVAILKQMNLAFVRFPGGTQSNYYQWRTGLSSIEVHGNSSAYTRYWGQILPKIRRAFPQGITMSKYRAFADSIGAETVLVPNLETSTVSEQSEWFRQMKSRGELPGHIELGNEFYLVMVADPNVLRKWPNERVAIEVTKRYLDALRPYLREGTKVAIQSAGSAFYIKPKARVPFLLHMLKWDADLRPEPWFDAVTVHLYPQLKEVLGVPNLASLPRGRQGDARIFAAMMARADQGVHRVLTDIEKRLPGKEIWVTEWNPRGADYSQTAPDPVTQPMMMHLVTRMTLRFLQHPSVAMALYFMANFTESSPFALYLPDGHGDYRPTPTAIVLRWFAEAANAGAEYQGYQERGAQRVAGGGVWPESYNEVEAALFRKPGRVTLLIQNASRDPRKLGVGRMLRGQTPSSIEWLSLPDLSDSSKAAPAIQKQDPAENIVLSPYSITRIVWE